MSPRTIFLARLIGIYSILVSLSMVAHKELTLELVRAVVHNAPLLFVCGIMAVFGGLAMVLGHNVWSGGALPVLVTLIGWLTLLKGALMLFLWPEAASWVFLGALHYERFFYVYAAVSLLLGVYLSFFGRRSTTAK